MPFQSNTNFNAGPFNRTQEVFNIQPVVPMHLSDDWNVISRTIIPLLSQPSPFFDSNTNGIGDITQSLFFSPTHPGKLIWGVGPVFTVPSANDPILGTGKFLFGPTAVFLVTPGHWVIGVLLNNQWSVGGNPLRPPVNAFLAQPFVNYNMAHGWYLTTSPIITSNWLAASGEQWTVPVGGGFGRVFRVGDQPVNASIARLLQRDTSDRRSGLAIAGYCRAAVPGQMTWRLARNETCAFRSGSFSNELGRPRDVRFSAVSSRRADIRGGPLRAQCRHSTAAQDRFSKQQVAAWLMLIFSDDGLCRRRRPGRGRRDGEGDPGIPAGWPVFRSELAVSL